MQRCLESLHVCFPSITTLVEKDLEGVCTQAQLVKFEYDFVRSRIAADGISIKKFLEHFDEIQ